jgi:hypothetical protein
VSEVAEGNINGQVLERKLHAHIESIDADMVCPCCSLALLGACSFLDTILPHLTGQLCPLHL